MLLTIPAAAALAVNVASKSGRRTGLNKEKKNDTWI